MITILKEKNFDNEKPVHKTILLENEFQTWLICGMTKSGKTESLFRTLLPKLMNPDCVFIVGKHKEQSIYKSIVEFFEKVTKIDNIKFIEDVNDVPSYMSIEKLKDTKNNICIFDDLDESKQGIRNPIVTSLFTAGRHLKMNTILCHQNYYEVPKTIRRNLTGLAIFNMSSGLDVIYRDIKSFFESPAEYNEYVKNVIQAGDYSFLWLTFGNCRQILRKRKNFDLINEQDYRKYYT